MANVVRMCCDCKVSSIGPKGIEPQTQSFVDFATSCVTAEAGHSVDSKLTCPVDVAHDLSGFLPSGALSGARANFFAHRESPINDRVVARSLGRVAAAWVGASGLEQPAIWLVARQAPGAMEHGQGASGILVDPDRALHVMEPVRVLWDLQAQALIPHRIVLGADPLFLHAQNLSEVCADPRDEGGAGFGCRHRKAPVVGREKLLGQIPVGRRYLRDPGQGQLFGQPILQGAEDAL